MNTLQRVELVLGDITGLEVDAVVNAANETLLGGGGVDGAIHRAAGPRLLAECRTLGGCPTGQARITAGYQLAARHVIHTVGPVYQDGGRGEPELLARCYCESLRLATAHGCRTVAFPAISCGVYRYPIEDAAHIACRTVREYLSHHDTPQRVIFALFGHAVYQTYEQTLASLGAEDA